PNAFSPNGDGFNDYFTLYAGKSVKMIKLLQIYDRWGGLVFKQETFLTNNEHFGWNGKNAEVGVYVYFAEVELNDGSKEILKGEVMLIR
ncbi:MAG: gliding motility-associated C-terminal domain-containing protein, partial [Candidatus Brocadiaceae bacterium]|nr:gliding motility-associated C-terminal domain-containing protein [Candidatus Brocadiaceae bacterium]